MSETPVAQITELVGLLRKARRYVNEHAVNASADDATLAKAIDEALKRFEGEQCRVCGAIGNPFMVLPHGWRHHSMPAERAEMWPFRCSYCGNFKKG